MPLSCVQNYKNKVEENLSLKKNEGIDTRDLEVKKEEISRKLFDEPNNLLENKEGPSGANENNIKKEAIEISSEVISKLEVLLENLSQNIEERCCELIKASKGYGSVKKSFSNKCHVGKIEQQLVLEVSARVKSFLSDSGFESIAKGSELSKLELLKLTIERLIQRLSLKILDRSLITAFTQSMQKENLFLKSILFSER